MKLLALFFIMQGNLLMAYDNKIEHTFTIFAPDAEKVYLVGEMNNWQRETLPMNNMRDGSLAITISLGSGRWMYKFVVDGKWIHDEANNNRRPDGYGGFNSILVLGIFADNGNYNPAVAHGNMEHFTIFSNALNENVSFNVYTPPRYQENRSVDFPVLFLLHGHGMNEHQWAQDGLINNYMDNLLDQKKIDPFVIIIPSVGTKGYMGQQEKMIMEDLYGFVKNNFRIKQSKDGTAVAGISMGGLGAFYLANQHQDIFGLAIPISGSFYDEYLQRYEGTHFALSFQLKLYVGTEDTLVFQSNENFIKWLERDNVQFNYVKSEGGHTWRYWNSISENFLMDVSSFFYSTDLSVK